MPFVRGTKIQVCDVPWNMNTWRLEERGMRVGDILTVSRRLGSGWMRARNERTHEVITLRKGPYIVLVPGWMHPSRKRAEEARLARVEAARLIWEEQQRSVEPVTSSESLVERRGFKPLVCDTGKAKSSAINDDVQKVEPSMQPVKIKNMVESVVSKTIMALEKEIKQLREHKTVLLQWRNKYLESTSRDAWELVEDGPAKSCSCAVQR